MARPHNKLTALTVERLFKAGLHGDGGGLWLQINTAGARSWIFRYQFLGRRHDMGLGSLGAVSLADARKRAAAARSSLAAGTDPIEARNAVAQEQAAKAASAISFKEAANRYIEANKSGWRNAKHSAQWLATLEAYAFPNFGNLSVAAVETAHVLRAVQPIWSSKTETARRVRGRIENILDWAKAGGLRTGDNPARWRGLLEHMLPKRPQASLVQHHPALPYGQIGAFMVALRLQRGTAARALEFTILTAARTSEVVGARISEFDLDRALWVVPANRIKAGREHRVPLSPPALAIAKAMIETAEGEFLFPGGRKGASRHSL